MEPRSEKIGVLGARMSTNIAASAVSDLTVTACAGRRDWTDQAAGFMAQFGLVLAGKPRTATRDELPHGEEGTAAWVMRHRYAWQPAGTALGEPGRQ